MKPEFLLVSANTARSAFDQTVLCALGEVNSSSLRLQSRLSVTDAVEPKMPSTRLDAGLTWPLGTSVEPLLFAAASAIES